MSKADQQRDQKLAAALRENLHRRKSQSRAAVLDRQDKDDEQTVSE